MNAKKKNTIACASGLLTLAFIAPAVAENSFLGGWPTSYKTDSGYEIGIKGIYQYDSNQFAGDNALFEDATTWSHKEFDGYFKTPFGLEVDAGYDFQTRTWVDNYLKYSAGKTGDFRLGQFKTPVGWDETESLGAQTFLERSLPGSAIYEGRRLGVDWTYDKIDHWLLSAGYYTGGDLNGNNDGHGYGGRVVYAPTRTDHDVLHLGLTASREMPDSGIANIGSAPEAGLTDINLVTTGQLTDTHAINRAGLEAGWMHGPFLAQAEYLHLAAQRDAGLPNFTGDGYYVFGTWMLTGESRVYKNSYFTNVKPAHDHGAVELAARYSHLDLRDGIVQAGREHDWTVGLTWYLGQHLKFQANQIWAHADDSPANAYLAPVDPRIFELRAQVYF